MKSFIGSRIRAAREEAGISQQYLAEKVTVSRPYIVNIEAGRKKPGREAVGRIASALGVTVDWLLTGPSDDVQTAEAYTTTAQEDPAHYAVPRREAPIMDHQSGDKEPNDNDWEWMARQLMRLMEEQQANERYRIEKAAETEQLRIREVDARHARNLESIIEEMRRTHHTPSRSDEGPAEGEQ